MSINARSGLASRIQPGRSISFRSIADALHLRVPVTLLEVVTVLEPITLSFRLNSGTCSGSCRVELSNDGTVHFTGHVHDSGALSASYTAIVSFPTLTAHTNFSPEVSALVAGLGPVVIPNRGHVGGTLSLESRDDSWDKSTRHTHLAEHWAGVKAAVASARADFGTNTGAFELVDGLANLAGGTWVFSF
jgi:hypothetical protein